MYKVEKTADTLFRGVDNMMNGAKEDYIKMSTVGGKELSGYSKEQVDGWDDKIKVKAGQKYIKIVRDNSVFAFVNIHDNDRFKKGDIFKAAGYNKPALNAARGNVLEGNYHIQWTGPLYLK
tara:strand:- start:157 stop:519 length:363 start_codon:yes stop_codon:yes gene_type:complete